MRGHRETAAVDLALRRQSLEWEKPMFGSDLEGESQHDAHVRTFDEMCADDELDLVCDLILSNLSTIARFPHDVHRSR